MKHKIMNLAFLLIGTVFSVYADTSGTLIGRFDLDSSEIVGCVKTFVNDTNRDLMLHWKLFEKGEFIGYEQQPILKKGKSVQIDLNAALDQICINEPKGAKKNKKYELCLELLRVKSFNRGPGHPLVTTKLKDGEYALLIGKNKFLKYDKYTLLRNKNGLLVCQVG